MDKVDVAIMRLREAAQMSEQIYGKPLVVTTSGGKDSSVCVALAEKAAIPFEVMHSHTTADAPETYWFIEEEFKRLDAKGIKCTRNYPVYKGERTSMWKLIPQKLMPPTRLVRYCCEVLKERGGADRFITTGVRWAESSKRKSRGIYETYTKEAKGRIILNNDNDDKRKLFEMCTVKAKCICNPIIDWTDSDVWEFIAVEHISVNPLYQCDFSRVGCIGCPMAGKKGRQKEFLRYPKFKNNYILAFDRMIKERIRKGRVQGDWRIGTTGEDVFHWWMEDGVLPGQINLFEEAEEYDGIKNGNKT